MAYWKAWAALHRAVGRHPNGLGCQAWRFWRGLDGPLARWYLAQRDGRPIGAARQIAAACEAEWQRRRRQQEKQEARKQEMQKLEKQQPMERKATTTTLDKPPVVNRHWYF
ncbi:hypothetical protein SPI_08582 [Niveomyces insectorum RCEF 264]|uniref:Uncharacterized protein n=1 Tax=Niveomyces insectorum RCEF 264 TaxID=1081102 RepID=A0A167N3A0_9HYPO|nr:hypothetical protein SPI_08582 [Niveomyces insectorum RCEF 264]